VEKPSQTPYKVLPLLIFVGALGIRLVGIDFGLPYIYHWDESSLAAPIARFLKNGDLLPHFYHYPTGYIYLQFLVAPASHLLFILKNGPAPAAAMKLSDYLLLGRATTAVIGAAGTTLAFHFAARLWKDSLAGIFAAALIALSPLHAADSRYLTTDIPMATFAFLGVFLLLIYLERKDWKTLIAAAAVSGAAVGMKYNAVLFTGAALFVLASRGSNWTRIFAFAAVAFLAFLLLTPGIIFENSLFLSDTIFELKHYFATGDVTYRPTFSLAGYLLQFWFYALTPIPVVCALVGLSVFIYYRRSRAITFLVFPGVYLVFLTFTKVAYNRGLEPLLPYLCLLAGLGAATLSRFVKKRIKNRWAVTAAASLIAGAFLLRPGIVTVREAFLLAGDDPRTMAKEWFEANVPWTQRVAKEAIDPFDCEKGGQTETPPIDAYKYKTRIGPYLVVSSARDYAFARVVYLITPNLKADLKKTLVAYPGYAEELRKNYLSIMNNSELVYKTTTPRYDPRPSVEIYRFKDEILRKCNPPKKYIKFAKFWCSSEKDPTKKMRRSKGAIVLKAPSRATQYFTAPGEKFTITVNIGEPVGTPSVEIAVDGKKVVTCPLYEDGPLMTSYLTAPPYFRHLTVRCLGPEGASFKLKYVIVERAQ
jgi:4-amino-4-deoxy-L-arabinose transferase-like glycosyltransferase